MNSLGITSRLIVLITLLVSSHLLSDVQASDGKGLKTPEEYLQQLREKGKRGDAQAQLKLGFCYFNGKYCPVNYVLAAMWFRKAADQGNGSGLYNLAICYSRGLGIDRDAYKAFEFFQKASEKGIHQADLNLSQYYQNGIQENKEKKQPGLKPDLEKAEQLLKKLVEKEYLPAYVQLSSLFIGKEDVPQEKREYCVSLLVKAVNKNDSKAMQMLADCYYMGWGCKKDRAKTLFWLRKAAENRNLEALAKLAYCYEYGEGVKPEPAKAFRLYKMAADKGHPMAQTKMGDYFSSGTFVKQNIKTALEWYKKAAEQGSAQAWFQLGVFAADGIGMEKNELRATDCFLKSAILGYPRAQYNLGCYLIEGRAKQKVRPKAAFFWFMQAAMQNDARAQKRLAFCYLQGIGTEKDAKKGLVWLAKAAENGDREAQSLMMQMK